MRTSEHATRASSAVVIYVIILVAFQVFLITVAVEAFPDRRRGARLGDRRRVGRARRAVRRPAPLPPAVTATGRHLIGSNVRTLFPGYFALVMATGIVAIGAAQQDLRWLAEGLYVIAAVAYVVLALLLTVVGWSVSPRLLLADLTSHAKGFAFLTIVAATNVLGSASGIVHGWWTWPGACGGSASPSGWSSSTPR